MFEIGSGTERSELDRRNEKEEEEGNSKHLTFQELLKEKIKWRLHSLFFFKHEFYKIQ